MTRYAAVSVTEFYGPETQRHVLSIHDSLDEAKATADAHDPDYDRKTNARHLRHNQSSPTRGEVMRIVGEGFDEREDYEADGYFPATDNHGDLYILAYVE